MAGSTPFVLPQYQGSMYDLQRQQALANALMQGAVTQPQQPQATGSGQYTVVPHMSPLAPLSNVAQGLLANKIGTQAGQGLNQLGQNQWQSLIGALGGGAAAQSPQLSPGSADGGVGVAGSVANPFAGTDGGDGTPGTATGGPVNGVSAGPQLANNVGSAPLNPLGMNPQLAAMMLMQSPDKFFESQAGAYKPTDASLMARAGGVDAAQANRDALFKANYIAPNQFSPNATIQDPRSGALMTTPSAAPAGYQNIQSTDGKWYTVPVQGGLSALQGSAAATAAGGAQFKPIQVYNPQTQQMEYSNEAQVTNPQAPLGIRNNNPGNLRTGQGGSFGQYPDMQTGLKALDDNLQSYGKQGINTVAGVISKWAPPNENDTQGYVKDVAQRLGISPNQKIDLSNPLVRQSLSTAIALRENGASGVFGGGGQPQSGRAAAGAPMGAQANAESLAKGQVDTMQKSYQNLQTVRSGAPAALQDVDNMSKLAAGASPLTLGASGAKFAGLFSANAAEYEKSRDNLVTNLGSQLGINSDAARDLVYGSIPSYGAPKQAVQNGLETLRGQIQTRLLKSDYLSDAYGAGDAKAYNQRENQFDQNMTPKMANIVSMPSGPARADALKSAMKDPQMRAKLEWAASNGVLK